MMDVKKIHEFMELVGRLKHMKRTGWVLRKIPDPETIAGHMYRMAILSLLADSEDNLDKNKREDAAMEEICQLLGDKGPTILQIFREYEKQESPEAQYVKDLDRLDLIMQAYEYEKRDNIPGKLEEFFSSSVGKIKHPFINKIADEISSKRSILFSNLSKTE
ncbi:hypothetical protein HZH68_002300 [Vespula germanica]|uniref:HD domain-containing protein n=1 Tax=Vespula germanica TaxID=30212 RepID=A0A834KVQ1_VESGE|nr:hypothetical protein HZH68_002300 [Vespula germanica]